MWSLFKGADLEGMVPLREQALDLLAELHRLVKPREPAVLCLWQAGVDEEPQDALSPLCHL